jgi:hypothetical protein
MAEAKKMSDVGRILGLFKTQHSIAPEALPSKSLAKEVMSLFSDTRAASSDKLPLALEAYSFLKQCGVGADEQDDMRIMCRSVFPLAIAFMSTDERVNKKNKSSDA